LHEGKRGLLRKGDQQMGRSLYCMEKRITFDEENGND